MAKKLTVEVWSDIACPWCYIGKRRLEAALRGLRFDFERIRPGNTLKAHRLLHLAKLRGVQDRFEERLLRGYLTEGEAIGADGALLRLATEVGLDADEVQSVLSSDLYAGEVRGDENEARALGVDGVPFFVIGNRYAIPGAHPEALARGP